MDLLGITRSKNSNAYVAQHANQENEFESTGRLRQEGYDRRTREIREFRDPRLSTFLPFDSILRNTTESLNSQLLIPHTVSGSVKFSAPVDFNKTASGFLVKLTPPTWPTPRVNIFMKR